MRVPGMIDLTIKFYDGRVASFSVDSTFGYEYHGSHMLVTERRGDGYLTRFYHLDEIQEVERSPVETIH